MSSSFNCVSRQVVLRSLLLVALIPRTGYASPIKVCVFVVALQKDGGNREKLESKVKSNAIVGQTERKTGIANAKKCLQNQMQETDRPGKRSCV